jgi:hypothetical protein
MRDAWQIAVGELNLSELQVQLVAVAVGVCLLCTPLIAELRNRRARRLLLRELARTSQARSDCSEHDQSQATPDVRLIKAIPKKRLRLVAGEPTRPPIVGDLGETDQAYTGFWGQMVLVYFESPDGKSKWEVQAYWTELECVREQGTS